MGMTWKEICNDPVVATLPYKIESDEWGNIVMSPPPGAYHSDCQGNIIAWLLRLLPDGYAQPEFPLQTAKGVKGIDVVWMSRERKQKKPKSSLVYLMAPEICVEVLSPKNTRAEINAKIALYFQKGAEECWICDKKGRMIFFSPAGQIPSSELCPKFPVQVDRD